MQVSDIDYTALTDSFCKPAYRIRTFFFDGKVQQNLSFHDNLRLLDRFEVFLGDVMPREFICPHCNQKYNIGTQKRVDVALAVELVHLATAKHVDIIALVAGDRDFVPAIAAAKHEGVIIRLIHGHDSTVSDQLLQAVDERVKVTKQLLESWGIRFESTSGKATGTFQAKVQTARKAQIRPDNELNEIRQLLTSIITTYVQNTAQKRMPVPTTGEEMRRVLPTWRQKYHVKMLKDLVSLVSDAVKWETIEKSDYLSLTDDREASQLPTGASPLRQFLLDTIKEFFDTHPEEKAILGPPFGILLSKKDKNWKKTFTTKSLTDALEIVKDKVIFTGKGPELKIRFK